MTFSAMVAVVVLLLIAAVAIKKRRVRGAARPRHVGSAGPAAVGAFYELLSEDRRKAIEIVVEDKAGYRDPEDAAGNLPELEHPTGPARP
jgi:hypothetical protein